MSLKSLTLFSLLFSPSIYANETTIDDVLSAQARPLELQSTLVKNAANKLIKKDQGGQFTLKGKDGTVFTVTFPKNSVPYDVNIGMIEIQELKANGVAFKPIGVQLLPDGLELIKPATLTIKTTRPLNKKSLALVTSNNDGSKAHLPALQSLNDQQVEIQLQHFSNYAVAEEIKIQEMIDFSLAQDEKTRVLHWLDKKLRDVKANPENSDYMKDYLKSIEEVASKFLVSKIRAAGTCEGAGEAFSSYFSVERQAALVGTSLNEILKPEVMKDINSAFDRMKELCLEKAKNICTDEHDIVAALGVYMDQSRFAQLYGDLSHDLVINEQAKKCMSFKFFMESEFRSGQTGVNYSGITAQTEYDIDFSMGATFTAAAGFLNADGTTSPLFDFQEGKLTATDMIIHFQEMDCRRTALNTTPGKITVDNFVASMLKKGKKPIIRIGEASAPATASFFCKPKGDNSGISFDLPPNGDQKYYQGLFMATHGPTGMNEMTREGHFDLKNSVFTKSAHFAEAVYNHIVQGVIHEITTIEIHHTPKY